MKSLALFTFACFMLALSSRFYAIKTSEKIQKKILANQESSPTNFFTIPTTQLMTDLQKLEEVLDKDVIEEQKQKDRSAALDSLAQMREEFELSFLASSENLIELKNYQAQINRFAEENDIQTLNTENFDILNIFYLMIVERMDFRSINEMSSLSDLFTPNELRRIESYVITKDFLNEVFQYKNISPGPDTLNEFQRSIASFEGGDDEDFLSEYAKNEEGKALDLTFEDGYIDDEIVRKNLKRVDYNEEQISEVLQGYEEYYERY